MLILIQGLIDPATNEWRFWKSLAISLKDRDGRVAVDRTLVGSLLWVGVRYWMTGREHISSAP